MAENLLGEITRKLNIEFQEIFKIKNSYTGEDFKDFEFQFGPLGLYSRKLNKNNKETEWFIDDTSLKNIITGLYEIVRPPFEPKFGDKYWTYEDITCNVIEIQWYNDWRDYKNKKLGFVFRTKNEALMERPDCYETLTGHAWMVEG